MVQAPKSTTVKKIVADPEAAARLARAIASDLSIYNEKKILQGLQDDTLWDLLADEIREGMEHFDGRVTKEIRDSGNHIERALVDVLLRAKGHIDSPIW